MNPKNKTDAGYGDYGYQYYLKTEEKIRNSPHESLLEPTRVELYERIEANMLHPRENKKMPWAPISIRYDIKQEIPGACAEAGIQFKLVEELSLPIFIAQDEETQSVQGIDFVIGNMKIQCKAMIIQDDHLIIHQDYFNESYTYTHLAGMELHLGKILVFEHDSIRALYRKYKTRGKVFFNSPIETIFALIPLNELNPVYEWDEPDLVLSDLLIL